VAKAARTASGAIIKPALKMNTESASYPSTIAIVSTEPKDAPLASEWSRRLNIPIGLPTDSVELLFKVNSHKISLQMQDEEGSGEVFVDFVEGAMGHRRRFGGGKGQTLAKAMGFKNNKHPQILDVTAGLGRDAFVLAHLGANVTMMERSPVIAALLEDGLRRANQDPELGQWLPERLSLQQGDACQLLLQLEQRPEIVYMDPMYPHRSKTALVKKEMRLLRAVVGDDDNAEALLKAALATATKRVVVKRPKGAPCVDEKRPSYVLEGKTTRYDIYLTA